MMSRPTRELPQQIGAAQLTQILQLHATSIALCGGAHLDTLKKYVHKFVKVAMTRYEVDTNLRGPTTKEMEAADKQIWCKIADLFNLREWSLDDAMNELTSVRSDIEALLQPRPNIKASMVANQSQASTGKGSGKGKQKSKSKTSQGRLPWGTELQRDGKTLTLCLRYNQKSCKNPSYKFHHACCFWITTVSPIDGARPMRGRAWVFEKAL